MYGSPGRSACLRADSPATSAKERTARGQSRGFARGRQARPVREGSQPPRSSGVPDASVGARRASTSTFDKHSGRSASPAPARGYWCTCSHKARAFGPRGRRRSRATDKASCTASGCKSRGGAGPPLRSPSNRCSHRRPPPVRTTVAAAVPAGHTARGAQQTRDGERLIAQHFGRRRTRSPRPSKRLAGSRSASSAFNAADCW